MMLIAREIKEMKERELQEGESAGRVARERVAGERVVMKDYIKRVLKEFDNVNNIKLDKDGQSLRMKNGHTILSVTVDNSTREIRYSDDSDLVSEPCMVYTLHLTPSPYNRNRDFVIVCTDDKSLYTGIGQYMSKFI